MSCLGLGVKRCRAVRWGEAGIVCFSNGWEEDEDMARSGWSGSGWVEIMGASPGLDRAVEAVSNAFLVGLIWQSRDIIHRGRRSPQGQSHKHLF